MPENQCSEVHVQLIRTEYILVKMDSKVFYICLYLTFDITLWLKQHHYICYGMTNNTCIWLWLTFQMCGQFRSIVYMGIIVFFLTVDQHFFFFCFSFCFCFFSCCDGNCVSFLFFFFSWIFAWPNFGTVTVCVWHLNPDILMSKVKR